MRKDQRKEAKRKRLEKKIRKLDRRAHKLKSNHSDGEAKRLIIEYHTLSFLRIHGEFRVIYGDGFPISPERREFWKLLPPQLYSPNDAQQYLRHYLSTVENALSAVIGNQSLAYWYHIYRRLGLGFVGESQSLATLHHTRAILDAAFQKYAQFSLCDRIDRSVNLSIDDVFSGEPRGAERELIAASMSTTPQLMLTKFTVRELAELYRVERLAYEIWRTMAMLRITGKGSSVRVTAELPFVVDERSDELDALVSSYDMRNEEGSQMFASHSGTIVNDELREPGYAVAFPLNLRGAKSPANSLVEMQRGLRIEQPQPFMFITSRIDLRAFLDVHRPLADAFEELHKVPLDICLAVISALTLIPFTAPHNDNPLYYLRPEMRGYFGSFQLATIRDHVAKMIPVVAERIGC